MIAVDTNVLVRFLTFDDPAAGRIATAFLSGLTPDAPGYVCREVMAELVWVLDRTYGCTRAEIAAVIEALLSADSLLIEDPARVARAVARFAGGGPGFSDQMILLAATEKGASVVTFDQKLGREAGARMLS